MLVPGQPKRECGLKIVSVRVWCTQGLMLPIPPAVKLKFEHTFGQTLVRHGCPVS